MITSDHISAKKHMVGVSLIRKNPLIKLQIVLTGPKALFWKSGNLIKLFLNFESWIFLKESWIEMSNYFKKRLSSLNYLKMDQKRFRRNLVISNSYSSGSKARINALMSRDNFRLNLNLIKHFVARYSDFVRKVPEISIDLITFSISAVWWWVFTNLSCYGNGQCQLFYIECQEVDWYSGKKRIYFKII